jgi:polyvinyl alcohol dehydrogenase (cytochrome)
MNPQNHRFLSRRTVLQAAAAGALAGPGLAMAQQATPVASPVGTPAATSSGGPVQTEWFSYGFDLQGTRAISDGRITSSNVAALTRIWSVPINGPTSSTPVISDGVAYVGSYDGNLYAIALADGSIVWRYASAADVTEPNLQIPLGITGSAHISGQTVYVGDSAAVLHAIDRSTGVANWTLKVDQAINASIWSSPVVVNGVVYVGVASIAKEVGIRGSVVAVDAQTGEQIWKTYIVPEGADGAGVFDVPAIDEARGLLIVGSQNAYDASPAPYGDPISVIALDLQTGEKQWAFNAPPNNGQQSPTDDVGFSASPTLFSAAINGTSRDLVGIGQKSGDFWVLDRGSGEQVWTAQLSPAGFLGGMEGSSAFSNGILVVPATNWPDFNGPASGSIVALDAATGQQTWSTDQSAPVPAPVAISNDLVFHGGLDGNFHAYGLADGAELWTEDLGGSVSGGAAISEGIVVIGAASPQFAEFIRPGQAIHGFALATTATPQASPLAPQATPVS